MSAPEMTEIERLAAEPGPEERYVDSEDPSVTEAWRIDGLSALDWALSRIADLEREAAENEAVLAEHIARLKLRHKKLAERIERGLCFFRGQVEFYANQHRAELLKGGKAKSRKLHHGTVGWKKKPAKAVLKDAEALLSWAQAQPVEREVLRIKEEPAWDAIKKLIEAGEELPPGTDYEPETEILTIKAEGDTQ